MTPLDHKLVERTITKIDEQDAKCVEIMSDGFLPDHAAYRYQVGRRQALADAKRLLTETFNELMEE